jgi:hypothetical protein
MACVRLAGKRTPHIKHQKASYKYQVPFPSAANVQVSRHIEVCISPSGNMRCVISPWRMAAHRPVLLALSVR